MSFPHIHLACTCVSRVKDSENILCALPMPLLLVQSFWTTQSPESCLWCSWAHDVLNTGQMDRRRHLSPDCVKLPPMSARQRWAWSVVGSGTVYTVSLGRKSHYEPWIKTLRHTWWAAQITLACLMPGRSHCLPNSPLMGETGETTFSQSHHSYTSLYNACQIRSLQNKKKTF